MVLLLWIGVHSTWHSQIRQRDRCLSKPKVGNLDSGAAGRDADVHHLSSGLHNRIVLWQQQKGGPTLGGPSRQPHIE